MARARVATGPSPPLPDRGERVVSPMDPINRLDGIPDGWRVTIHRDTDPSNPRDMSGDPVHVLTVPSREYVDVDKDPGPWGSVWRDLLSRYRWSRAIEIVQRWARLNGAYTYDHDPYTGARSLWYLTREDAADWTDPDAALKAYAEEYQAWAEGDVYGYVIEREVTWQRVDGPDAGRRRTDWETVESVWGFYGPDMGYVEQEAREALAHLIAP